MSKSTKKRPPVMILPGMVRVQDYHDFPVLEDQLKQFVGGVVKVAELGLDENSGEYVGLVYAKGSKPSKADVKFMLNVRGYKLMEA